MAVPKPPPNPKIDPKVLARRQKDLDGFIDQYQEKLDQRAAKYADEVKPTWKLIGRNITDEIKAVYNEIQDANGVLITKKPINPEKLRNMERNLKRLASLQAQLVQQMGTETQAKKLKNNLAYSVAHGYYFHAFGIEQAAQVEVKAPILTQSQVMGLLANPWLPDGKTYSDRIRGNTTYLAGKMKESLTEAVGNGWGINRLARRIQDVADEGYHNAVRLARTEMNRAAAQGATHAYMQNADILDGKRWNATLDKRTAPKDAANDGKIYELDYDTEEHPGIPGERIPNHPNCRCKYSPVLSALGVSTRERIARGDGDTVSGKAGERIYTKARTYREYAKERGLPDLDERLRNDNPRRYLRRGESLKQFIKKKTPATVEKVLPTATASTLADRVNSRIAKGVTSEQDAVEVGDMVRQEIEQRKAAIAGPLQKQIDALDKELTDLDKQVDKLMDTLAKAGGTLPTDKLNAVKADRDRLLENFTTKSRDLRKLKRELKTANGNVAREVISEIRPLGNPGSQLWATGSNKMVKEAQASVSTYLPSDWLQKSNQYPMKAKKVKRGWYSGGSLESTADYALSGNSTEAMQRVAIHEMGHRVEHLYPEIRRLEHDFYKRRTEGEALTWMGRGYSKKEKTRHDDFLNPYMGKDYGNKEGSYYEILSMGLESVFMGSNDIAKDKDYYNFVLGVITSIK